jgi:two-component system response regulator RegX3
VIRPVPVGVTRVLVVDGQLASRELLSRALTDAGFVVESVATGHDALAAFDAVRPAVVLMDAGLPDASGLDVCCALRERGRGRVPIIMVGAHDSELEAVVGLELGADDYVTKPLRLREVVARVRARLRWAGGVDERPFASETLVVGPVRMDPARHEVTVGGRPVALPLKEFGILEVLLTYAGQVVTRATLLDRVWGSDYYGDGKTLDVHVARLRSKLAGGRWIVTVRGVGYRFEALSG